jgi:hypothetical protein
VRTWLVPGCGHSPHGEARAAVLRAMAAFIRSLPAPAATGAGRPAS